MLRLFIITISILCSNISLAKPMYQVDLIIFVHPQSTGQTKGLDQNSPLIPVNHNAITLKSDSGKSSRPYTLLTPNQSQLRDEYYRLSHKSSYQVLGHYSWRQPANNQSNVALPAVNHNGWQMQGTLRIKQSNYYLFDADLQFSPPANPSASFTVIQNQRLKGSVVYYFDHSRIGMLVKVHKLA